MSHPRHQSLLNVVRSAVLLLGLLAPSVWVIATIPPLWRDADAYTQLTQDPRIATFWGHAPAYCYLAKIPLFLGEQWERMQGLPSVARLLESQPAVTDSGIWLLIGAQHLSLALAIFFFIKAVSQRFWVRLTLAFIWASNALFYTFAHCLGSETLGMILIVLVATQAVRLVQSSREPTWWDWYLFSVLLVLCILARDLNLALVVLLPLAFVTSWLVKIITRKPRASDFRHVVLATAVSIVCLLIAHSIPQNLVRKTKLHPHSRIGFTFFWRLHLLDELSPEARTAFLHKAMARAPSGDVRNLIALLEQLHAEGGDLSYPGLFLERSIKLFGGPFHWEDLDRALNQMAFTFLWPPMPEVVHAAGEDFVTGVTLPSSVTVDSLFATTAYYFQHRNDMPACARLVTFRGDASADRINKLFVDHRYFHLWERVTYRTAFVVWIAALIACVIVERRKALTSGRTNALGIALAIVGLINFSVTSVLHDFEPRFVLSMWELLLLSLFLVVGGMLDPSAEKEKSAGQLLRPEP